MNLFRRGYGERVKWSNLNPQRIVTKMRQLGEDTSGFFDYSKFENDMKRVRNGKLRILYACIIQNLKLVAPWGQLPNNSSCVVIYAIVSRALK